jgi:tetraacyldisaccharide 4'-kinase
MRDPAFWWREKSLSAALLSPVAACYGAAAARRMQRAGDRTGVPVVCVGNFTLGGAGKTPTVIALAKKLIAAGEKVFCLSRGYGGRIAGPKQVDAHSDTAADVGDEALLLAHAAPTIVSRDRVAGAHMARARGATVVLMDDGLQNGAIAKDFTIAVIDGKRGIGNGRVFPAGPLRAPIDTQLTRCDALLVVAESGGAHAVLAAAQARALPILHGRLVADSAAVTALKPRRVLAFAGIGDPEKFFATVAAAGIAIAVRRRFPDHYRYTAEDAAELVMQAEADALTLLTTEKDHVRMTGDPALAALCSRTHTLPVSMVIEEARELQQRLSAALKR